MILAKHVFSKAPTSGSDEDDGLDGGKVEHQPRGPAPKQLYTGKDLDKEFEDAEVVGGIYMYCLQGSLSETSELACFYSSQFPLPFYY